MSITVEHNGSTYEAELSREPAKGSAVRCTIYRNGAYSGSGRLTASMQIEDCAAVLDDGAYEAIESAIEDAMARGLYAEFDPS
jgi:hypothetical protein